MGMQDVAKRILSKLQADSLAKTLEKYNSFQFNPRVGQDRLGAASPYLAADTMLGGGFAKLADPVGGDSYLKQLQDEDKVLWAKRLKAALTGSNETIGIGSVDRVLGAPVTGFGQKMISTPMQEFLRRLIPKE